MILHALDHRIIRELSRDVSPQSRFLALTAFPMRSYNALYCRSGGVNVLSYQPLPDAPMSELTHFNESGRARMVDVSQKSTTERVAVAQAKVYMRPETLDLIHKGKIAKGDVLAVAQVAGVMGAKRTPDLIPMCHPLMLTSVNIDFEEDSHPNASGACSITIMATAKTTGQTGVEMEAMTAVSVAALTIYDMCKAVDKGMSFGEIFLVSKSGGKSGTYTRPEAVLSRS